MAIKDKLPVSYLLFTFRGRINRLTYWTVSVFIWTIFYVLFNMILFLFSYSSTLIIYPLLFLSLAATAVKRLHDMNKSGYWLWLMIVPVLGPSVLIFLLGFKKGSPMHNRFGVVPDSAPDYFKNGMAESIPHLKTGERIVNDITRLNPVIVSNVAVPESVSELQSIIKNTSGPVSTGGGRFSMGGQTASAHSTHIDMRKLNKIISFSAENKVINVEAGIRWCDIQKFIDPFGLSIKIMQTYANFTVGGALSVNCHGRYTGSGAVILSVKSITVILAGGEMIAASAEERPEIFFACIGCYNAIGVIASAELMLTENIPVKRINKKMEISEYKSFFSGEINHNKEVIFHNADIYPPSFRNVRAVSWIKTDAKPTVSTRLMPLSAAYPVERYFINAFSKSRFGKWRRENIIDPLFYLSKKIHWRNYEAGYDVLELEPESRKESTFVLQEYFIPVQEFENFSGRMSEIFKRHWVNVLNVSVRHAQKDPGSLLAWARKEVFAFVIWYKQSTTGAEKNKVAVWTRELIQAAVNLEGSYYLPYQAHATSKQFHQAYPDAVKLFEMKKKYDPGFKFRNIIWDSYYDKKQ